MKRLKTQWMLRLNSILTALIALLGLSSCRTPEENEAVICMYGVPTSKVVLAGDVKNEAGAPIEGIRVSYTYNEAYDDRTALTDKNGKFEIGSLQSFGPDSATIVAEDVDSIENGNYQSDSVSVKLTYDGPTDAWNMGTASVSDIHIVLKEK